MGQLDNWRDVAKSHQYCMQFVAWLHDEHGIDLDWDRAHTDAPLDIRTLVDEFFDVDREALEQERVAVLDALNAEGAHP